MYSTSSSTLLKKHLNSYVDNSGAEPNIVGIVGHDPPPIIEKLVIEVNMTLTHLNFFLDQSQHKNLQLGKNLAIFHFRFVS
jgi:hypothetical protein